MKRKEIRVSEIVSFLGEEVESVCGDVGVITIDNLADVKHVTETTLDWVKECPESQQIAKSSPAKVMIVGPSVVYDEYLQEVGKVLIKVKKPKLALVKIGNHFFVDKELPGIHPTAIISPNATIGKDVCIGPYTVIGGAQIGDGCVIDSQVRIYDDVIIGVGCRIKSGAVIGGEGFGFEKDEKGNRCRFPQIGRLLIGDDVEIGANTCVDRGALSDTQIGNHTKINNLCHIAHNNIIGNNVVIAGCVNLSGGNVIEDNVWIAPNASLVGYVHIGENATVGMGAVVVKDIPANEVWVGNPAKKLKSK